MWRVCLVRSGLCLFDEWDFSEGAALRHGGGQGVKCLYTRVGDAHVASRHWRVEGLRAALRLQLCVVAGQLQADANVILHAAHFAAECDPVLLECVCA